MSLELAIAKLTTAVEKLTAELEVRWGIPPKAEGSRSASSTPPASTTAAPVPPTAPADATPAGASSPAVKYDGDAISKKTAINRPAVVALLSEFGAQKGPQLKEADYPEFFRRLALIEKAAA